MSLDRVLFVRADKALVRDLDALLAQERAAHPGHRISRSDLVRALLLEALRVCGES